jgi:nitroreductase
MNKLIEDRKFWENAINSRRSVRSYKRKPVETDVMNKLKYFSSNIYSPFEHSVKITYFKTRENKQLANSLKKPPEDAVAFIVDTSNILNMTAAGFIGELVILYAQGLGISSCWYGHYILDEIEQLIADIDIVKGPRRPRIGYGNGNVDGMHAVCISPLGYFEAGGMRLLDRLTSHMMSFKRKTLDELLLDGITEKSLPDAMKFAFDLARKAPSGGNTQHWRYKIGSDFKTVDIQKIKGYKHFKWEHCDVDIGICAAHFWIGLCIQNIDCEVNQILEDDCVKWRFKIVPCLH